MRNTLLAFVLVTAIGMSALPGYGWQNVKALTETNLIDLLQSDVSPGRVAELAAKKGIDFEVTPGIERDLRKAGANTALIATLKSLAPKPAAASVAPLSKPVMEPASPAKSNVGSVRINPKDGQRYVWIPAGTFQMGCSLGDSQCDENEKPLHSVRLTKGFWMGQTPVTVAAWKDYRTATGTEALPATDWLGRKNWNEAGDENMPAVMMTWHEASNYCKWAAMHLPTEAEWEYAARAQTTIGRYSDLGSIAWYADNSGKQPINSTSVWNKVHDFKVYQQKLYENGNFVHRVGQKQPNAWRLYDMLGNVNNWCADWLDQSAYSKTESQDPLGPPDGKQRETRGGSWFDFPQVVRVSSRIGYPPDARLSFIGCRCVGELP